MNNKLLIIILIIIIVSIIIYNKYKPIKIYDTFADKYYKDPQEKIENDGKMMFEFLKDPYYSQKIINQYYLNDDKKINGVKVNYHPYAKPVPNCPSSADTTPYIYSANPALHCRRNIGNNNTSWWWRKYDTRAQDIYNQYSIRR